MVHYHHAAIGSLSIFPLSLLLHCTWLSVFRSLFSIWATRSSSCLPQQRDGWTCERRSFSPVLLLQPCFSSLVLTKSAHSSNVAVMKQRSDGCVFVSLFFLFFYLYRGTLFRVKSRNQPIRLDRSSFFFFSFLFIPDAHHLF